MTRKKSQRYEPEFKRHAVELADQNGIDSHIEQDLGLYQGAIRTWRKELLKHEGDSFPGSGNLHSPDEELRNLRREIEILRQERDILKKAVAIFSLHPSTGTHS